MSAADDDPGRTLLAAWDAAVRQAQARLDDARSAFYAMYALNQQLVGEIAARRSAGPVDVHTTAATAHPDDHPGIVALCTILRRFYEPKQGGGIPGYRDEGGWGSGERSLGTATGDQLDALFALAGLVPQPVEVRGPCRTCRWAYLGYERGYAFPCLTCTRPWHSNYEPAEGAPQDDLGLPDRIVRRVQGVATDLDRAVDLDRLGRPHPYVHLVAAAKQGGREAVVRVMQGQLDQQDAQCHPRDSANGADTE